MSPDNRVSGQSTSRDTGGSAPDRRYPSREHLRRNQDFQEVFRDGIAHHGTLLVLFLLERPGIPRQVGFVAGRKVGNAVRRNRAKRLLREAYRHLRYRLPLEGLHIVLVARRDCARSDFASVHDELERLLDGTGILNAPSANPASESSP